MYYFTCVCFCNLGTVGFSLSIILTKNVYFFTWILLDIRCMWVWHDLLWFQAVHHKKLLYSLYIFVSLNKRASSVTRGGRINVFRSTPFSSLSSGLISKNDPFTITQTHPHFQKQVILVLQLDNLLLSWLIHTPFLSPSLTPRRKETETRGFASRWVAVLCEAYEKREKKGERFFGEAWQGEPGAHLRSSGS